MDPIIAGRTAWALDDESRRAVEDAVDHVHSGSGPAWDYAFEFLNALEQRGYTLTRVQTGPEVTIQAGEPGGRRP